jgi:uncharacterized protein
MIMKTSLLTVLLAGSTLLGAQTVQVNRANKTIAITATDTVETDPDLAIVEIGYQTIALTRENALDANLVKANAITKALTDAGVPKDRITTTQFTLVEVGDDYGPHAAKRRDGKREYTLNHIWHIKVAADDAEKIIGLATAAGANVIGEVSWQVAEPIKLEAEASAAAIKRARAIAEQIAAGMRAKLGELVYASNTFPVPDLPAGVGGGRFPLAAKLATKRALPPPKPIQLFPEKVIRDATVHAVFAIE